MFTAPLSGPDNDKSRESKGNRSSASSQGPPSNREEADRPLEVCLVLCASKGCPRVGTSATAGSREACLEEVICNPRVEKYPGRGGLGTVVRGQLGCLES